LQQSDNLPVTIQDIRAAAENIKNAVKRTPARYSHTLSQIAGCDIVLKFENFQFTASFKDRGALNKLLSLTEDERRKGVIAMSAGNHAQGVAYHAGRLKIPATIVMPTQTPFNKVKHTKAFGANVVLFGNTLSEASEKAMQIAGVDDLALIHPYDDPLVIAGQGTVALELLADHPELDCLVVPIGGGGLISGIAIAANALKPGIVIYGVQTAAFPSMADVVHGTATVHGSQTIAEGIAVKHPGFLTRAIIKRFVKDILLVTETEIESALAQLLEVEKVVVEGAAAAALAAILSNRQLFEGKSVGIVLTGGNIDMRLLSNVILRELTREGRIQSIVLDIEDRPGFLANIAQTISAAGGNILDVHHDRITTGLSAKSAVLSVTFEARDVTHAVGIRKRLEADGYQLHLAGAQNLKGKIDG
jgi:threonine dehydratase